MGAGVAMGGAGSDAVAGAAGMAGAAGVEVRTRGTAGRFGTGSRGVAAATGRGVTDGGVGAGRAGASIVRTTKRAATGEGVAAPVRGTAPSSSRCATPTAAVSAARASHGARRARTRFATEVDPADVSVVTGRAVEGVMAARGRTTSRRSIAPLRRASREASSLVSGGPARRA